MFSSLVPQIDRRSRSCYRRYADFLQVFIFSIACGLSHGMTETSLGEDDIHLREKAHAASELGLELSRAKDYLSAAERFSEAIRHWEELSKRPQALPEDTKQLAFARHNYEASLASEGEQELGHADSAIASGNHQRASTHSLAAARAFHESYLLTGSEIFQQKRNNAVQRFGVHFLKESGRVAEPADANSPESIAFLKLALDHYQAAEEFVGSEPFRKNKEYAEAKLAEFQFSASIRDHLEAKNLRGPGLRQEVHSLSDFRGEVVLVFIFASWCENSQKLAALLHNWREIHPQKPQVFGAMVDGLHGWKENEPTKRQALMENLNFPSIQMNHDGFVDYGWPRSIPMLVWIDHRGRLIEIVPQAEWKSESLTRRYEELRKAKLKELLTIP